MNTDRNIDYFRSMLNEDVRDIPRFIPTVPMMLEDALSNYADDFAIDGSVTYRELCKTVGELRGTLLDLGIGKGTRVAILMGNEAAFIYSFLALTTLGAIAVPTPLSQSAENVEKLIKKLEVSHIIYTAVGATTALSSGARAISFEELSNGRRYIDAADIAESDPAAVFFTGGTTGRPKGALLSQGALMRGTFNGIFMAGDPYRIHYIAIIPFTHVFGLVRGLMTCLDTGSCIYTLPDIRALVPRLAEARPNILVLVPALADMLLGLVSIKGVGALGGELKTVIAGGAQVSSSTIKRWEALGVRVHPGYGLTETANLVSGNGNEVDRPDSVGKPYPGQELRFEDGELWVKGDNIMECYLGDEAETASAFEDGYFKTGDLARIDDDGFLYITGRIKNIMVLQNGENVSPEELEYRINAIPLVKDSMVYLDQSVGGGIIACDVFVNAAVAGAMKIDDPEAAVRSAIDGINAGLPQFMRIAKVEFRSEDFKRSGSMKIIRDK